MPNNTRQKKLKHDNAIRERLLSMHGLPPGYEHLHGVDTAEIIAVLYQHVFELIKEVETLKCKLKK